MKYQAYAKINLGLDVLRQLPDGYHEVSMIMQSIALHDTLTLEKMKNPGISLEMDLTDLYMPEHGSRSAVLSDGSDNLAFKAADLLVKEFGITEGVSIHLQKHIPIAAGMAGGSTDAAAVLHMMNEVFRLGLSPAALAIRGKKIGADVPYCLMGGTALAEGIGEILTPLPAIPHCRILIGKPDISVSTKFVYQNLKLHELDHHPDIRGMRAAIEARDMNGILKRLENVLETVTIPAYPVVNEIKECMLKAGAAGALMSGSGPTVFGIFTDEGEEAAEAALKILQESNLTAACMLTEPRERKLWEQMS